MRFHRLELFLILVLSTIVTSAFAQTPLGAAFTYQGRLDEAGAPADGSLPMIFKLWDAESGGNQVGPSLVFDGVGANPPPVSLADGLFSVSLDFGATAFGSNARWLEITVNGTTLSPRQRIAAAPAATFSSAPWATNGSTVSYSAGDVQIGYGKKFGTGLSDTFTYSGTEVGHYSLGWYGDPWDVSGATTWLSGYGGLKFFTLGTPRLAINRVGDVGIGTTSPSNMLSVNGSADFAGNVGIGTTSPSNRLSVNGSANFVGNVGIGTPSPSNRLTVMGGSSFTDGVGIDAVKPPFGLATSNVSTGVIEFPTYEGNAERIILYRLDGNGVDEGRSELHLRIGDNANSGGLDGFYVRCNDSVYAFNSNSDARKTGVPQWLTYSDARMKHDIQPLTGALDLLLALKGHTFQYNDPSMPGARPGNCMGFIAQEVQPIIPEWVGTGEDGMKTMHTTGFEALAVEAIRDLREEKDAEIAAIRAEKDAQIRDLYERIARLEAMIVEK